MQEKTFITELNHEQVDIFAKDESLFIVDGEEHIYFNARIHWGLKLFEDMKEMDITPFIDKIEITSGTSVSDNKMIIVKHDFVNIVEPPIGSKYKNKDDWKIKMNFLRDDDRILYLWHITIFPKFVAVDVNKNIVEVLFNA